MKKDKPKLIFRDGKPYVTDGYISGSKFIVTKQPSIEAINKLHEFFIEQVKRQA